MTPDEHRRIRKGLGLSQAGLAARLGVRVATISDRETGRKAISTETALLMRLLLQHGLPGELWAWRPIEALPATGQTFLIAQFVGSPYGWVVGCGYQRLTTGEWKAEPLDPIHAGFKLRRPTHWMPLPAPPAA